MQDKAFWTCAREFHSSCAHADYVRGDDLWRVVDTVGLQDTGLTAAEALRRFELFSEHTPAGIDVFAFVLRWGRFKPEHEATLSAFVANAGEGALAPWARPSRAGTRR